MFTIMKNAFNVFKRNKEFIMAVVIQPVLLFLLMSVLLPYTKEHSVGVCNASSYESAAYICEALEGLDGIRVEEVEKDDLQDKLMNSNIEIAVIIADNPLTGTPAAQVVSIGDSEIKNAVEEVISATSLSGKSAAVVNVNEVPKKGINISTTLAFMIFKTLTAASLLGSLIVEERRNKIRDRIFLSGISRGAYLGGMSVFFFICMAIGTTLFFAVGQIFNFDFGMKYEIGYLIMMYITDLLSVAIYVFTSAFAKSDDGLWMFSAFVLMPMSMFSGILFPYEFMPQAMQVIGSCFPHRWIAKGVEIIQQSGSLSGTLPYMGMLLILCIVLFAVGTLKTPRRAE